MRNETAVRSTTCLAERPTRRRRRSAAIGTTVALFALGTSGAGAAHTATATLSNGAQVAVSIDSPLNGAQFNGSSVNVPVSGTASIGVGAPAAKIIYVIDVSGSTTLPGGTCGTILACEKAFFVGLNNAVVADGSTANVGVVAFASGSSIVLGLTPPADPTVNTAINGLVAGGGTNCAAGLSNALTLVNTAPSSTKNIVVFASDGVCNAGANVSGPAGALGSALVVVHSVAIGTGSNCTTNGGTGTLGSIAQNGGTCTAVSDPNNLPNIIQNLIGSSLTTLSMSVDGNPAVPITNLEITPDLPIAGAATVNYSTTANGLTPGTHTICVTATGTDVLGDTKTATACVTVEVLSADLSITKTGPALVTEGGSYSYTLTVTNNGPSNSTGVTITDALPANATFVSATGCTVNLGVVTCSVGALTNGASAVFTINMTAGSAGSSISNTGTVAGDQSDPVPANNSSTAVTTLNHNPVCTTLSAGPNLWPPNHKLRTITLTGATDPDGNPLTWNVTGVTQDEPTNGLGDGDTAIDAVLGSGNELQVRAERSGLGDGRVYRIAVTVTDGLGGSCTGIATVGVPHSQSGPGRIPVDSGGVFNSLI